ncbi:LysR family transcriptional regulator [Aurantimonas sp. VKM B-3413]|uniref:LysR family transcriptional regulator n=1 Tax=Aurantimonas sp. VKM B-3413 TaxID=2779401 RepID=UPI001E61DC96|nr:LysR family transcriptional regulator [Aurantimonas sp. VKM B-3413]MCB8836448.1 LysR family transcriptional regulator [Aurantimonas sp. VKM B-3413]
MAVRAFEPVDDARGKPKLQPGEAGEGAARLWLPLNALRAFEAVAERLSFTGAAAALHISQSALSRHVGRLEELIGCKLLERRPQGLVLTQAGAALLPVVSKSFDRIEATMETLRRKAGSGPRMLRVHMPPTFMNVSGLSLLREFRLSFPEVAIDLFSSNGIGLPPARGSDIAVVFDRPKLDDVVRDPLWMISQTPACAPEVAERCKGMDLAAFLKSNELLHTRLEGEPFGALWSAYARHFSVDIPPRSGLAFDSEALAVQWALAGNGIVLVDINMFAKEIAEGRLVTPFDATRLSGFGYYLAVHPDDMSDPAIALFRSWVIQRFARVSSSSPAAGTNLRP